MNHFFGRQIIKKAIGIKWWERILLFFKREYVAFDADGNDKSFVIHYKYLRGRIYILKGEFTDFLHTDVLGIVTVGRKK